MQNPKLRKFWQVIPKHDARLDKEQLAVVEFERRFLWRLIHKFFDVLDEIPLEGRHFIIVHTSDYYITIDICPIFMILFLSQ